jgi:hypothetical protein
VIWFDDERKAFVQTYLKSEAKAYTQALEFTAALIDGFESPFGMELLATVDWLLAREGVAPTVPALREGCANGVAARMPLPARIACLMTGRWALPWNA